MPNLGGLIKPLGILVVWDGEEVKFLVLRHTNVIYRSHMKTNKSLDRLAKYHHLDPLVLDLVLSRKNQKLTQQKLADMAGVSRRTVVLIEAGGDCTLTTLRRLVTALGLETHVYKPRLPTLEDMTRENERLFAEQLMNRVIQPIRRS